MKDIRQKLLATFQIEHRDHVEQIRSLMAMIENTGTQPEQHQLEEVFRRAHSLKGAARAVDLAPIEGLAHRLETLFSRVRKGACTLDRDVTSVVQQVLDASEDYIAGLAENRPGPGVPAALESIERILGMETSSAAPPVPVPEASETAESTFQPVETVRITAHNFEGLFRSAGGLVTESQRQDQVTLKLSGLLREISLLERESEQARQCAAAIPTRGAAHGELARLTFHLDTIHRQLRGVSREASALRRAHQRSSWNLRQLGKQLQQDIWQARMVPAESLMEGFRKLVRDLARDEGKEIEFQAGSTGIHADRRVLEALKDPVRHLLRNAISHGLETPAERIRNSKLPVGRLTLRMDCKGHRLTLVVQDDGRGMDFARIREVAAQEGILSESAATQSSPQELARILFRPGFSTAPAVTNLSGRGMGLSVVYETIRRLQGDLQMEPCENGGTAVTFSVPLTITSHRLLLIDSGGQRFALPILAIERLQRIPLSSVETVEGKPVAMFDGQPVPLTTIQGLLGLPFTPTRENAEMLQFVVLRSGGQRAALVIDAATREIDAVVQDLGQAAGCGGKVSSAVVLDDGSVAFVINPLELMQGSGVVHAGSLQKPPKPAPKPKVWSILVVDDSMTTRTLEKSILEAHGYRVRIATDGVEALDALKLERADLVVADIEMPRLNGFGLIAAMKKDRDLDRIPVIIVSSLERQEDRERGLALGADAYVIKRKFDQEELLATIRQIL